MSFGRTIRYVGLLMGLGFTGSQLSAQTTNYLATIAPGLSLQETIQKVLIHNESLQAKLLDAEIARRQYKAEKGIFEPAVVASYDHVDNSRENTIEQQQSQGGIFAGTTFAERNDLYNGGLEFLSPIGSKFRLGYDLRHLRNSLQHGPTISLPPGASEWVTTVGATLTQPILKNFGRAATMARIRLAAINSDLAFEDYRRQVMLTVSRAEAAYWDLYFSQEQARISQESVELAESIYKDNKARQEVGKSSELEVLQAEAGAALRRARRNDAAQKLTEAGNQLSTMFSGSAYDTNIVLRAAEQPALRDVSLDYYAAYKAAFENNPDYLTRRHQAVSENVRLAFLKNQKLPQLDFKASYGLNGRGLSIDDANDDVSHAEFPAWSVGVEFRIPVTGGIKERNDYQAARLSQQKSLVNLKEIEVQIGNALNTAILKVNNLRESADSHRSVIHFHEQLLETQLARLEVGVIDSRTVLETEEKLFEARMAVLDNLVQYQKALLELELVKGTTLANRNLELTKAELQILTERLLAANSFSGPEFDQMKKDIQQDYETKIKNLDGREKPQTLMQSVFEK
jgi:outer membrane protein